MKKQFAACCIIGCVLLLTACGGVAPAAVKQEIVNKPDEPSLGTTTGDFITQFNKEIGVVMGENAYLKIKEPPESTTIENKLTRNTYIVYENGKANTIRLNTCANESSGYLREISVTVDGASNDGLALQSLPIVAVQSVAVVDKKSTKDERAKLIAGLIQDANKSGKKLAEKCFNGIKYYFTVQVGIVIFRMVSEKDSVLLKEIELANSVFNAGYSEKASDNSPASETPAVTSVDDYAGLGGVRIGVEYAGGVKAVLGDNPSAKAVSEGTVFSNGPTDITVRDGYVIGISTEDPQYETTRGVHAGDDISKVIHLYGNGYSKSSYGALDLYEFSVEKGERRILRFAVNRKSGKVEYIGLRVG